MARSGGVLGASWGRPGGVLGASQGAGGREISWGAPRAFWGSLGAPSSLKHPKASWRPLGAPLLCRHRFLQGPTGQKKDFLPLEQPCTKNHQPIGSNEALRWCPHDLERPRHPRTTAKQGVKGLGLETGPIQCHGDLRCVREMATAHQVVPLQNAIALFARVKSRGNTKPNALPDVVTQCLEIVQCASPPHQGLEPK